ncbi:MAG TPA: hypothetical protein VLH40_01470 [Atribacteraceae bacterium]|nr:hypothetical protein [Atribacteraceae bacterium]
MNRKVFSKGLWAILILPLVLVFPLSGCWTVGSEGSCFIVPEIPDRLNGGERYRFQALFGEETVTELVTWSAVYGTIAPDGWYTAPLFSCQEEITARWGDCTVTVSFLIIERIDGGNGTSFSPDDEGGPSSSDDEGSSSSSDDEGSSSSPEEGSWFLSPFPEVTGALYLDIQLTAPGKPFLLFQNGELVASGAGHGPTTTLLRLNLREGENELWLVVDGQEVARHRILRDAKPPQIVLEKAVVREGGVTLSGRVVDETEVSMLARLADHTQSWLVFVPFDGTRTIHFEDRGGNVAEKTFTPEEDLSLYVALPLSAKEHHPIPIAVELHYRDIPLEEAVIEYVIGGESAEITLADGRVDLVFPGRPAGEHPIAFRLQDFYLRQELLTVLPQEAAFLDFASLNAEWPERVPFAVSGKVTDGDGVPCPNKSVMLEVNRPSHYVATYETITGGDGFFAFLPTFPAGGRYDLLVRCGAIEEYRSVWAVSAIPDRLVRVSPADKLIRTVGTNHTFTMRILDRNGSPVHRVEPQWRWEDALGNPVVVEGTYLAPRTTVDGFVEGRFLLPTRAGTYRLIGMAAHWGIGNVVWAVTTIPAASRHILDLSGIPEPLGPEENVVFRVRVTDTFHNPAPGREVRIRWGETGSGLHSSVDLVTNERGEAEIVLSFPKPGSFTVRAMIRHTVHFVERIIEVGA